MNFKHGKSKTPSYGIWRAMHDRCKNPKSHAWDLYGGRGITVCEEWGSFENFYADMGDVPAGMSLDRKNNDKGYSPDNCRWASREEQGRNRRTNHHLTYQGKTQCIADWADELGMSPSTILSRVLGMGWTTERALTQPVRHRR